MSDMNYTQRVREMDKQNPIPVLDGLSMLTRNMIAEYLKTDISRVRNCCTRHQKALAELGARNVSVDELEKLGYVVTQSRIGHVYSKGDSKIVVAQALDYSPLYTKECVAYMDDIFKNPRVARQKKQDHEVISETTIHQVAPQNVCDMQVFSNETFGSIRTIMRDGEPWFVAADVCKALEINNNRDAISRLDDDEKNTVVLTDGNRGNPNTTIINEPGLYTLVLGSRKPEAKAFKRWITHDVIPSLRKNGAYIMGQETMTEVELIAKALIACKRIVDKQEAKIAQLQCENTVLMGEVESWDYPSMINALVRSYATSCCKGRFDAAWTELYRKIRYKHHIDVKRRKNETGKGYFKCIKAEEMPIVAQVAAAMCESAGLDVAIIINSVNAEKVS